MDYHLKFTVNETKKQFDVSSKSFTRGEKVVTFDRTLFSDLEFLETGYVLKPFSSK